MCGISGFCDFSLNYYDKKPFWKTILVQMHETVMHRGPDQAMIDLQPHVGLSHARLSIRDLRSGIQPMTRYSVIRMSLHPLTKTVCRKFWRSVRHAPPETAYSQA